MDYNAHNPPAVLQKGDVLKTWYRDGKRYVNYEVVDTRPHEEGGQVVLARSKKYGTWRFRWWPGHYCHSKWRPVFVRRGQGDALPVP